MKGTVRPVFYLLLLLLLLPAGCREKEQALSPEGRGEVRASQVYVEYFGQPPTVSEGSCYALVGYYPTADRKGVVRPFPLFLFNPEEEHPQILVEQLLGWGENWDLGGVFSNPFPRDSRLVSISRENGDMFRVELSAAVLEQADRETQQIIAGLIGHTLLQFEGVERVMVVAGGALLPGQADRGFVPDPGILAEPGPPAAIAATATWEAGAENPEELSVFFDRPVRIDTFRLTDARGEEIEGKYYRSVFDMAVVIHPENPAEIRAGMPVQLAWEGKDFRNREGRGDRSFNLRRMEHP